MWEVKLIGASQSLLHVCEWTPFVKGAVTGKFRDIEEECRVADIGKRSAESIKFIRELGMVREENNPVVETARGEDDDSIFYDI